ncbi:DUF4355 domain-containing protein [Aerococcus sp. JJEM-2022b]|uniref:DUF4355 domain-containing protein n=1 Tax=Aerococcus mictus TaxID=2976810 RepID=UPI00227B45BE|nr:DUF4355 domain-containing protein [Aerococcus mictus]MCY3077827.1 DUF4355 domain-containing protein [Aerococcus mictus]
MSEQEKQTVDEIANNQETNPEEKDNKEERTFTRDDLGKMIGAERKKWDEEKAQEIEEAKSEAERLAKLSKDEREKEQERKRKEELDKREKAIAYKELRIETRSQLSEEGLPLEFLDVVMADNADAISENIKNIRVVFDEAVEKRVDERLAQKSPKRGTTSSHSLTREEILSEPDAKKRLELIRENRDLF